MPLPQPPAPTSNPQSAPPQPQAQSLQPPPVTDDDMIGMIVEKARTDPTMLALQRDRNFMRAPADKKVQMWVAADPKAADMDPSYQIEVIYRLFEVSERARLSRRADLINEANSLSARPANSFWGGVGGELASIPQAVKGVFSESTLDSGLIGGLAKAMAKSEVQSRQTAMNNAYEHLQEGNSPEERGVGAVSAAVSSLPAPGAGYFADIPHRAIFGGEGKTVAGELATQGALAAGSAGVNKVVGKVMPSSLKEGAMIKTKTTAERSGSETLRHVEILTEKSIPGASPFAARRLVQAREVGKLIKQNFVSGLQRAAKMKPQDRGAAIQKILTTYKDAWESQYSGIYRQMDELGAPGKQPVPKKMPDGTIVMTEEYTAGAVPIKIHQLKVNGKPIRRWAQEFLDVELAKEQFGTNLDGTQLQTLATKLVTMTDESIANKGVALRLVRELRDTELSPAVEARFKPVRDQLTKAMLDGMQKNPQARSLIPDFKLADQMRDQSRNIFDSNTFKKMLDDGTAKENVPDMLDSMSYRDVETVRKLTLATTGGRQMWRQWIGNWFERKMADKIMSNPDVLKSGGGVQFYKYLAELDNDGRLTLMLGKDGRTKAFQFAEELQELSLSGQSGVTALGAFPAINTIFGNVGTATYLGAAGAGAGIGAAMGSVLVGIGSGVGIVATAFIGARLFARALANPEMLSQVGKLARSLDSRNVAAANMAVLSIAKSIADKEAKEGTPERNAWEWLNAAERKAISDAVRRLP